MAVTNAVEITRSEETGCEIVKAVYDNIATTYQDLENVLWKKILNME
jgi:hypothetical protein